MLTVSTEMSPPLYPQMRTKAEMRNVAAPILTPWDLSLGTVRLDCWNGVEATNSATSEVEMSARGSRLA